MLQHFWLAMSFFFVMALVAEMAPDTRVNALALMYAFHREEAMRRQLSSIGFNFSYLKNNTIMEENIQR